MQVSLNITTRMKELTTLITVNGIIHKIYEWLLYLKDSRIIILKLFSSNLHYVAFFCNLIKTRLIYTKQERSLLEIINFMTYILFFLAKREIAFFKLINFL